MKSKNFRINNNKIYIGNNSIEDIAKQYGTPVYVYDEDDIITKMRLFVNNLSSNHFHAKVVYASKAFLVPALVDILNKEGLLMDAMSITDMEIAKMANYSLEKIVFHGNNKSNYELEYAVKHNIGYIVVDNIDELKRLIVIAKENRKVVNTLFRINPLIDAHTHKYIQTAVNASKFGENIKDIKTIDEVMHLYLENSFVKLLGFHAHIGSQIKEMAPYELLVNKMLTFSYEISKKYHIELTTINFGGGFGIEYYEGDSCLVLDSFLKQFKKLIEVNMKDLNYYLEDVMVEPGRSIIAEAGMTVYQCDYIKKTLGNKRFLFIDGGMTDNIRPALYQAKYQASVVNNPLGQETIKMNVVGKCCESGDFIIKDAKLPVIEKGDLLLVYATGAYTYSMNIQYNGQLKPAVVFVNKSGVHLVSKRQTIENICEYFQNLN